MPLDEPSWWYQKSPGLMARGLSPIAGVYGWFVGARVRLSKPYHSRLPVLCAGNFTAGGSGKTPLTRHLCHLVQTLGKRPVVLSRGYGGRLAGPHWVKADDIARDTGDEPLLLARTYPVLIARDRAVGARVIEAAASSDVIVMDDGLQNPRLHKDLAIAMVDGARGLGNGRVIPAGPLRAPLASQFPLAQVVVVNDTITGTGGQIENWLKEKFDGPVLRSRTVPAEDVSWLRSKRIVAWAGISGPNRFFGLIEQLGAQIVERFSFRDHVSPTPQQAATILNAALSANAVLVCTEKDSVRLSGGAGPLADLASASRPLPIRLDFGDNDEARLTSLVRSAIEAEKFAKD